MKVSCQSPSSGPGCPGGLPTGNWPRCPIRRTIRREGVQRWLIPSSCRRRYPAPTPPSASRPASWPSRARAPSWPASARPRCWSPPTRAHNIREGIDFFPLTVDVEERMYAAGRIPGSFFRREGRPTDLAILTCRLIDRPLRPSFADGYRNETQVVVTVVGVDGENPYDVLAINGASAALMVSGIPFEGPIGAVRIAWSSEGTLGAAPDLRPGRGLDVRAGRGRAPARRRRHRHHDGRGRRHRAGLAPLPGRHALRDRRGHRRGPRGRQDLDPRVDRGPARAGRAPPPRPT